MRGDGRLQVCLVLNDDNRAWIIEKMARRLAECSKTFGVDAVVSDRPMPGADVMHWMSYAFANERHVAPTTMYITHIDDPYKLALVRSELQNGVDIGICMSSHSVRSLVAAGVPSASLCHIVPGHDARVQPRRIVIGITTRVYEDGRKREKLLVQLAGSTSLEAFRFDIFGSAWEDVVPSLERAGAEVRYFPGTDDYESDYAAVIAAIPGFDYYLYLGMDEGSLGTLDALAAGVATIITPQGFHLDLNGGITHAVETFDELRTLFVNIAAGRQQRVAVAAALTWERFAERHALVWHALAKGQKENIASLLEHETISTGTISSPLPARFYLRVLHPLRIRSALSHASVLKPLRRWLKSRKK